MEKVGRAELFIGGVELVGYDSFNSFAEGSN
jgi:hypothetical protein